MSKKIENRISNLQQQLEHAEQVLGEQTVNFEDTDEMHNVVNDIRTRIVEAKYILKILTE